jgi:hypothetical protein
MVHLALIQMRINLIIIQMASLTFEKENLSCNHGVAEKHTHL